MMLTSTLHSAVSRRCPICGRVLADTAPEGLCLVCLIEAGLEEKTNPAEAMECAGSESESSPPRYFGDYEILAELGRGGMGVVYEAQQFGTRRTVALKLLSAGAFASSDAVHRFHIEAQAAARLEHPHIVPVYEAGMHDGQYFLAMRFMPGGNLGQWAEARAIEPRTAAKLIRSLAQATSYAHQHGVLHRDIKPGNILLDESGEPYLADFGLARLSEVEGGITLTAAVLGTAAYMAPEQATGGGGAATTASDIYGLGAVLYELLAGQPPFTGASLPEVLRKVRETEPAAPPMRKSDVVTICLKCLEKEPAKRYATAQELADDLDRFLNYEPILARPVSRVERFGRWCRRRPAIAGLSAALVLAVVAGFAGTLWQLNEATRNALENRRHIARLNVFNGLNLMQEGDHFRSLLWFAEALALNLPERGEVDRQRIASIIVQNPKLVGVLTHENQPVGDAAFHPVKDQIATVGRDRRLRLWEIPSGAIIYQTEPFSEPPSGIQFAPDGERLLVTTSALNQARLLFASRGELLAEPIPHFASGANNQPLSPRFDSTGQRLLTQSAPKTLRVWSAADASPLGPAVTLNAPIARMNFSEDDKWILVLTQDGEATAWDWQTGNEVEVARSEFPSTSSGRGSAQTSTPPSGVEIQSLLMSANRIFSPDKTMFATASPDHRVRVWSAETSESGEPLTPPIDHHLATGPLELSANARYFFTIHPARAVFVWDLRTSAEPPVLLRPGAPAVMVDSGREGAVVLFRDPNNPIRVRALAHATEVSLHPSSLKSIPVQAWFDASGQFVILEGERSRAQIWDAATGLPVTPVFQSRYATGEEDYRIVKLSSASLENLETGDIRSLAELLSGSQLDGTGGWKPLEFGEIVARWNHLYLAHSSLFGTRTQTVQ